MFCQSVSSVSQCGLFVALPSSWDASVVICCVVHWLGCSIVVYHTGTVADSVCYVTYEKLCVCV